MRLLTLPALILVLVAAAGAAQSSSTAALDAAFAKYWSAKNTADAAKAAADILKSGAPFDDVCERLERGRPYSEHVPTGIVTASRGDFPYAIEVPSTYDPSRAYQVRIQLHGGVGGPRDAGERRIRNGIGRLAGAEQIYVLPAGWAEAPWWSERQVENLRAILDSVKRTYNVDENHVVISGVSDGGTGAYYVAMRDTTPYAAFLPLNGYILVLSHAVAVGEPDLFPNNLRNKPLFAVNGGRDPLYPIAVVEPSLNHLAKAGVSVTYKPQPQAGHETSWWPIVKDAYETFVREHARQPLPDRLTWETSDPKRYGRAHWLQIDALGSGSNGLPDQPDINEYAPAPQAELGFRLGAGLNVTRVVGGSMGERLGLKSGDVIQQIGSTPLNDADDLIGALQKYETGAPIALRVLRDGRPLTLSGSFDPNIVRPPSAPMFRRSGRAGRVDLVRSGNVVEAKTRGVTQFTLLISPDQFDFNQPIRVTVNGRVAFEGSVEKNVGTLLKWAARDNDRTMLFGAELRISTP